VSASCVDLLKKMLTKNPVDRPSSEQCYNHNWFLEASTVTKQQTLDHKALKNLREFHVKHFNFNFIFL
jgi:serine/threonine protein kinase